MSWRSADDPTPPSLGLIELSSIALGIRTVDEMAAMHYTAVRSAPALASSSH